MTLSSKVINFVWLYFLNDSYQVSAFLLKVPPQFLYFHL